MAWYRKYCKTKKELIQRIRNIINNQPLGIRFNESDELFLKSILEHHYKWEEKKKDYEYLIVKINYHDYGTNRGLYIVRTTGEEIDISWTVCLETLKAIQKKAILTSLRNEIADQRNDLDLRTGEYNMCQLCNCPIDDNNTHLDHVKAFKDILNEWKTLNNIDIDNLKVTQRDNIHDILEDREIANKWQEYHKEHAVFRRVHKHCNLTRA